MTFTLTITNVQDVPVAVDQTASTSEDTFVDIPVTTGASDADGDTLIVSAVTDGAQGTTAIRPGDQLVRYTPAANTNGLDSFTFTISDGHGNTASATVDVTIAAEDDAPSCPADSVDVTEDLAADSGVACTDADEGDTLSYEVVDQPAKGAVTMAADGSFTYTPDADLNGTDAFTYRAVDGTDAPSSAATVSVAIAAVDDPPSFTVGPDVAVAEDAGPQTRVGWASDISVGGPDEAFLQTPVLSVVGNTGAPLFSAQPAVSSTGTLTFTGKLNAEGTAVVTVRLSDGVSFVDHTFTITLANVADPPNAVNDTGLTVPALSAAKTLDVLGNDLNPDPGETLTIVSVTQGAKGRVAIAAGGSAVTYAPTGCNVGSDTFTYTVSDGNGGTDNGTVLISITRDTQKPTSSIPASAFVAATQLGTSTIPMRVTWCATDPGTGIARYQLQQSTDSKAFASVTLASAKATSISRTVTFDHRYRFRVRGIDGDGSVGTFSTGANSLVTRVEDASSLVKYTGSWSSVVSGTASGGKVRYTSAANASATYTFTGRAVAIASPTSSSRGSFKVYVDGVLVGTVSEKTSSTIVRRVVFARTLTPGTHTLKLVAVGNGRIDLDAIITLS
jgi:VCBS repeat-containing protein